MSHNADTAAESSNKQEHWIAHFLYEKVPVILVGNKVDLESEREVSAGEGQALAEEWGCPFMETSAKSKTMVDELFAEIVRQMDFSALPDRSRACLLLLQYTIATWWRKCLGVGGGFVLLV
ncbi:hypothetical protein CRUP_013428 [Coryphaenoides rupestris]|nr:hypothetical protein CRUP_013428 [Coryphaenoides rupestris]